MSDPSDTTLSSKPTPERILDAAEALFAERDYDGVSTRAITERAGVRLNLLSYYFETKEKLFKAVIDRRLDLIVERRELAMADLRASGMAMTVKQILESFIHPYYDLASHGDPGWLNYARLIAAMSQSERHYETLDRYMQRTVEMYLEALHEVLPDASLESIKTGFYFAITLIMASFSGIQRIKGLTEGTLAGEALEQAYRPLVLYAEAGILALANTR